MSISAACNVTWIPISNSWTSYELKMYNRKKCVHFHKIVENAARYVEISIITNENHFGFFTTIQHFFSIFT